MSAAPPKESKEAKAPAAAHGGAHAPLPFHKQLVAGGTAGIIEILAMYPTDVVKTRHQLSKTSESMMATFRSINKNEGFGTFYRGISSPILAEAPKRAIKFASNDQYKALLKDEKGQLPPARAFVAGALAGSTEMFFNCPFEVVKVRVQAKENRGLYSGTLDCAQKIFAKEGFFGFYKGGEPQLWRNAVWNGIYFGIIGSVRELMPVPKGAPKSQEILTNFTTGLISGSIATIANTPFDVVKSRMQNQLPGQALKYNWSFPSLMTIHSEEGLKALYKGLGPRLLRLGPGGGIMIVAYDKVSEMIR